MKSRILFIFTCFIVWIIGCNDSTIKDETGDPSLSNRIKWKKILKVTVSKPNEPLATTRTQISNVSRLMAAAKINQALETYEGKFPYRLSTVFQIAKTDTDEGGDGGPAITTVVVRGHQYYVAMLDYPKGEANRAAYEQTGRAIPAIGVADAEDETRPAWIRIQDENGHPYKIKIYLGDQSSTTDDHNIYRFLRNRGYRTYGLHRLDNPTLEVDDDWRPYFTVTYVLDDAGKLENGHGYWAEKFILVDPQNEKLQEFSLDNPFTARNERDPKIPDWVDQVYSERVLCDAINYWGYNTENFGKTSKLNQFEVDGNDLYPVMNEANTNLVYTAYITSSMPDVSTSGIMLCDPRTGECTYYLTEGKQSMAIKSAAFNAVKQATTLYGYYVEDMTIHTIYGERTWEGVLTRPAVDNSVGENGNGHEYGTLYAATFLLRADYDVKPANVIWANNKQDAFLRYEQHLVMNQSARTGSNVLEDKEVKGVINSVDSITVNSNTSYIVTLKDHPKELWEVRILYVGDPRSVEIFQAKPGSVAVISYGDPKNRKSYFVREFHLAEPETGNHG
jgi:hypothetical protein